MSLLTFDEIIVSVGDDSCNKNEMAYSYKCNGLASCFSKAGEMIGYLVFFSDKSGGVANK